MLIHVTIQIKDRSDAYMHMVSIYNEQVYMCTWCPWKASLLLHSGRGRRRRVRGAGDVLEITVVVVHLRRASHERLAVIRQLVGVQLELLHLSCIAHIRKAPCALPCSTARHGWHATN